MERQVSAMPKTPKIKINCKPSEPKFSKEQIDHINKVAAEIVYRVVNEKKANKQVRGGREGQLDLPKAG